MLYLKSFSLPTESEEGDFLFSKKARILDMSCYTVSSAYPFQIFPFKHFSRMTFEPVTIFYGGNGSGKSTLLNIIAEKLALKRTARYNKTPLMPAYLDYCRYESLSGGRGIPEASEIITSDGVFDFLLDLRAINEGIDGDRERLFEEYYQTRDDLHYRMRSLADYEELKRRNEIRRHTASGFAAKKMGVTEFEGRSNGESAYFYFTDKIKDNALYLLDEPENSLSPKLQKELATFLEEAARFYNCQFIISTHTPFLLAMKGAKIYDLDCDPVTVGRWTELENIRVYRQFFKEHEDKF